MVLSLIDHVWRGYIFVGGVVGAVVALLVLEATNDLDGNNGLFLLFGWMVLMAVPFIVWYKRWESANAHMWLPTPGSIEEQDWIIKQKAASAETDKAVINAKRAQREQRELALKAEIAHAAFTKEPLLTLANSTEFVDSLTAKRPELGPTDRSVIQLTSSGAWMFLDGSVMAAGPQIDTVNSSKRNVEIWCGAIRDFANSAMLGSQSLLVELSWAVEGSKKDAVVSWTTPVVNRPARNTEPVQFAHSYMLNEVELTGAAGGVWDIDTGRPVWSTAQKSLTAAGVMHGRIVETGLVSNTTKARFDVNLLAVLNAPGADPIYTAKLVDVNDFNKTVGSITLRASVPGLIKPKPTPKPAPASFLAPPAPVLMAPSIPVMQPLFQPPVMLMAPAPAPPGPVFASPAPVMLSAPPTPLSVSAIEFGSARSTPSYNRS